MEGEFKVLITLGIRSHKRPLDEIKVELKREHAEANFEHTYQNLFCREWRATEYPKYSLFGGPSKTLGEAVSKLKP